MKNCMCIFPIYLNLIGSNWYIIEKKYLPIFFIPSAINSASTFKGYNNRNYHNIIRKQSKIHIIVSQKQ